MVLRVSDIFVFFFRWPNIFVCWLLHVHIYCTDPLSSYFFPALMLHVVLMLSSSGKPFLSMDIQTDFQENVMLDENSV